MKKIIKIILVLFVTLTLGACGSSEEKDTNKPTKTEEKKERPFGAGFHRHQDFHKIRPCDQ